MWKLAFLRQGHTGCLWIDCLGSTQQLFIRTESGIPAPLAHPSHPGQRALRGILSSSHALAL